MAKKQINNFIKQIKFMMYDIDYLLFSSNYFIKNGY